MWNDVNKILPEKDGDYLVVIKDTSEPTIFYFDTLARIWIDEECSAYRNFVTHWMPLPLVPGLNDINLNNITYGKAIQILECISDHSEEEIVSAIYLILKMPSIMAVTKSNLLSALRYLFNIHYEVCEDVE